MARKQKKHEKGKKNDRDISRPQENPQSEQHEAQEEQRRKRGVIKTIALYLMVFMICLFGFTAAYVLGSDAWGMLDISKIKNAQQSMILYDFNGEQVAFAHGTENRIWVSIDEIPQQIRNVFVAAEDVRFYSHPGVDIRRIFGALWEDIKAGGKPVQGASTITQQLIKNSHLSTAKNLNRKIEEVILSIQLERECSKDEILEMYLNYVYFGAGTYGIEAASQYYFSIPARELSLSQAASLAAILKSPTNYAPHNEPENNLERRNIILGLMEQYEFATPEEVAQAKAEPLGLQLGSQVDEGGWYIDAAMEQAAEILGISVDELISGGYRVYTEMDTDLQEKMEQIYQNEELFPEDAEDGTQPQSAMVVLDNKSGAIRAMVGGREYVTRRGLNRAINLQRQPGSAIKPLLVYAPALKSGKYTAANLLIDEKKSFGDYEPDNYGDKYYGPVTMRTAVQKSLNVPAVEILDQIGIDYAKGFAESIGIPFEEEDTGLSLALGGFSKGISPLQLCAGYVCIANGGTYHSPKMIQRIENAQGQILYEAEQEGKEVLSEADAFILTDMLRDVVEEGTGRSLKIENVELAGKTGTNDYEGMDGNRDCWMAAYNPDYSAVVWMGYDVTDEAHYLPKSVTGGTYPAKVLQAFFSSVYEGQNAPSFTPSEDVERVKINEQKLFQTGTIQILPDTELNSQSYFEEYLSEKTLMAMGQGGSDYQAYALEFRVEPGKGGYPEISFVPSSSLANYVIMRQEASGEYIQLAVLEDDGQDEGPLRYLDQTAEFGKNYTYYIVPVARQNATNRIGPETEKASIVPQEAEDIPRDGPSVQETPYPITEQTPDLPAA